MLWLPVYSDLSHSFVYLLSYSILFASFLWHVDPLARSTELEIGTYGKEEKSKSPL
jgi:hypothetical protein